MHPDFLMKFKKGFLLCSLARLMHPQLLVLTDTPGKLNNLVNAVLLDLDQKASPNEELGPCSAFQFFPVGSRIEQALPQLLTKKPSVLEHQRPRQSIYCLIKGLTQQEVSPLSLWSTPSSSHQTIFVGCFHH